MSGELVVMAEVPWLTCSHCGMTRPREKVRHFGPVVVCAKCAEAIATTEATGFPSIIKGLEK